MYGSPSGNTSTLRDAFITTSAIADTNTKITLQNITQSGLPIPLVSLDVRVSGAMVGATSSTVNRKLETYFKSSDVVSAFLSGFSARISGATTTTTNTTNTNTPYTPVNINSTIGSPTINNMITDLNPYTLNGNPNIFSIKGNVTLCLRSNNPGTLTLE